MTFHQCPNCNKRMVIECKSTVFIDYYCKHCGAHDAVPIEQHAAVTYEETPPPQTWTAEQAAKALGYSLDNVYYLCKTGRLLAHRVPSHRGKPEWVIESLERQERPSSRTHTTTIHTIEKLKPANAIEAQAIHVVLKMLRSIPSKQSWGETDRFIKEYIQQHPGPLRLQDLTKTAPAMRHSFAVYCSRQAQVGHLQRILPGVYEVLDREWAQQTRA